MGVLNRFLTALAFIEALTVVRIKNNYNVAHTKQQHERYQQWKYTQEIKKMEYFIKNYKSRWNNVFLI